MVSGTGLANLSWSMGYGLWAKGYGMAMGLGTAMVARFSPTASMSAWSPDNLAHLPGLQWSVRRQTGVNGAR